MYGAFREKNASGPRGQLAVKSELMSEVNVVNRPRLNRPSFLEILVPRAESS
jgi:hypothetical protein